MRKRLEERLRGKPESAKTDFQPYPDFWKKFNTAGAVTGIAFGLLPALRTTGSALFASLSDSGRSTTRGCAKC